MTEHWGDAEVRMFLAASDSDLPMFVGAFAEVRRDGGVEMFRTLPAGSWYRVEGTVEELSEKDSTLIFERRPEAFGDVDPQAAPSLRHGLEQVALARRIATEAHAGQTDKASRAYIDHPRRVAARLDDLEGQAAAWLHDVLEDTPVTEEDLRREGVDDAVIEAVRLVTRTEGDDAYYARIAAHPLARAVKLADIADNTDPERTALLDPATRERLAAKYATARRILGATRTDDRAPSC